MEVYMVTQHAARRFLLRVCAEVEPWTTVLEAWQFGDVADDAQLADFRVSRQRAMQYRVNTYNNIRFLLVATPSRVVTVLADVN